MLKLYVGLALGLPGYTIVNFLTINHTAGEICYLLLCYLVSPLGG